MRDDADPSVGGSITANNDDPVAVGGVRRLPPPPCPGGTGARPRGGQRRGRPATAAASNADVVAGVDAASIAKRMTSAAVVAADVTLAMVVFFLQKMFPPLQNQPLFNYIWYYHTSLDCFLGRPKCFNFF